jgi:DNA-binding transcriptional regulator YhcF (GntR family)
MNRLLQRESLSEQVADALEKRIVRGELHAGARLQSTRDLAAMFKVSHQVVLCALDFLETKKLIRRLPRKGVYVADSATCPDTREVLILIVAEQPTSNSFFWQIINVVDSEQAAGRFHFTLRILTLAKDKRADALYKRRMLAAELPRLIDKFHPDCALVIYPSIDRRQMEMLLELPFPLLFVGDFLDDDFPGVNYNQLAFRTDPLAKFAEFAAQRGMKRVTLLQRGDRLVPPFLQHIFDAGEHAFAKVGIGFELYNFANMGEDAFSSAMAETRPDMLIFTSNDHEFRHTVIARLQTVGLDPGGALQLAVMLGQERDKRFIGLTECPGQLSEIHSRLVTLMDKMVQDKLQNHHEVFQLQSSLDL